MTIRSMVRFALLFMLSFTFNAMPVFAAAAIPSSPCDSLYYETLSARAWLEAQREITQNQNIILKPDSVFEYTCFDKLLWELADHADDMLSETGAFGGPLAGNAMDTALQNLVAASLQNYASNNFGGPGLLAGHTAALGIQHIPGPINAASPYTCDIMKRVWQAAKCVNFISNSSTDGFFTFDEYATTNDKRLLPDTCSAIGLLPQWQANLATALTTGPWTNDPVQTYFNETSPEAACAGACACTGGDPIPTGVKVVRSGVSTGPTTYDEYICLQPGCRYHPGGDLGTFGVQGADCYGR